MKIIILCAAIGTALFLAVQAQTTDGPVTGTPMTGGTGTPGTGTPGTGDDDRCEFNCRPSCILRRPDDRDSCPRCNATCNERCPEVNPDCPFLTCGLTGEFELDDDDCPECECEDEDEECPEVEDDCLCYRETDNGCRICALDVNNCPDDEQNQCTNDRDCDSGECYAFGDLGFRRCVERPGVGMMCVPADEDDEDDDDDDESDSSFSFDFDFDCADDTFCSPETSRCVNITGTCPDRNRDVAENERFECQEDGTFEPLQCRRIMSGGNDDDDDDRREYLCRCVNPGDGSLRDGEPFRVEDRERDEARRDCVDRVYRPCSYLYRNQRYSVRHGMGTVIIDRCQRCRCNNGSFEECRALDREDCRDFNPTDGFRPCEVDGQRYEHGERIRLPDRFGECNQAECYNGRVARTRNRCNDDREPDDCDVCEDMPRNPVCGIDGRTYRSACFAVECAGLNRSEIRPGRCPDINICMLYPCRRGERCVALRGDPCFGRGGCRTDRFRRCVNVTELRCRTEDTSEAVCDTEGRSHDSICRLPQETSERVQILHERRCDDPECSGGRVCGTDGVSYENDCHRRTRSARARRDYMGDCDDSDDTDRTLTELCQRVRREQRCRWNSSNCDSLVRPREGCCPICGGGIYIANDPDAVRGFAEIDEDFDIDAYLDALRREEVIPKDISSRCDVELTPTGDTDIEVTFMARDADNDAAYCFQKSMDVAAVINEVTMTTELPQELAFATAASPASAFIDSGAPKLAFSIVLLLAASLVFLLF